MRDANRSKRKNPIPAWIQRYAKLGLNFVENHLVGDVHMTFPQGLKIKERPGKSLPHTPEMVISSAHGYGNNAPNLYIFTNKWLQPPNKYVQYIEWDFSTCSTFFKKRQNDFTRLECIRGNSWWVFCELPYKLLKLSAMQKIHVQTNELGWIHELVSCFEF